MEYVVFTDESYITAERFRSIGAVSFRRNIYEEFHDSLGEILADSCVSELKWKKVKNAKYRLCTRKMLDYVLPRISEFDLRVDVLIWDTHDARHTVKRRDDTANFERMFYHVLRSLMARRPKNAVWHIRPDQRLEINWHTVNECLKSAGKWRDLFESPLFGAAATEQNYRIKTFKAVDSVAFPCCQVADFFAGIAVFSINQYTKFNTWRRAADGQLQILDEPAADGFSNKEECRFKLLKEFVDYCKRNRLGVSLETHKRLSTRNPGNPINFWHYKPQHASDKAPVRD